MMNFWLVSAWIHGKLELSNWLREQEQNFEFRKTYLSKKYGVPNDFLIRMHINHRKFKQNG